MTRLEMTGATAGGWTGPLRRILVVDDSALARDVISEMLRPEGFDVIAAATGAEALAVLGGTGADLILLDVMLPEMDGFETCRRIRELPNGRAVPVIMVTALTAREHRIAGLDAGADDFVSKPVDKGELLARIRSQLRSKALMEEIERKRRELEALQESREALARMILHDLKGPIGAVEGCLHILRRSAGNRLTAAEAGYIENGSMACRQAVELLENLLDVLRMERREMPLSVRSFDVTALVEERTRLFQGLAARRNVALSCEIPADCRPLTIRADPDIIARVLSNLIQNAIRHTPEGRRVTVSISRVRAGVELSVSDEGEGISRAGVERILRGFDMAEADRPVLRSGVGGIGLYFCGLAAKVHGGNILVESEPGKGSRFRVYIPAADRRGPAEEDAASGRGVAGDREAERPATGDVSDAAGREADASSGPSG
ncbi:MAG: hybrid sensor histidine kinase/response regulator [Planctomycetota bacterium]|nr:hybrid sensor histidine kinase/response regulator [Planctomycetota bacterium]